MIVVRDADGAHREQKEFSSVGQPVFSHDSKRVAYAVDDKMVVIDGRPVADVKKLGRVDADSIVFSPRDNRFVAYRAPGVVIIGDHKCKSYDEVWPPVFSPDGKQVIYGARDGRKLLRIIEEVEVINPAP